MPLKKLFQPTREKVKWTIIAGVPLTLFGWFIVGISRHGAGLDSLPMMLLLLPYTMMLWFLDSSRAIASFFAKFPQLLLIAMVVLQFMYYYVLVALVLAMLRERKG